MSMRQTLMMMFSPIRLQKLSPACRYAPYPVICQKNLIAQLTKEYNYSDYYDGYYGNDYIPVKTPEETFSHYLAIIFYPYLLLMGTVGNIMSVILLRRYSKGVWSTCLYMTVLLPMDLIKLYVECGNNWLINLSKLNLSNDILHLSNAVCKVYSFSYSLVVHETQWITVAVGIETAIATRNPMLIYHMCTRERATAIILFISVLLISLNLHFFWTTGLTRNDDDLSVKTPFCTYINELSDHFRDYIWPNIDFCIQEVLPFLILTTAIIIAFVKVLHNSKTDKEDNKRLEKYFLDIISLKELRTGMQIVCLISVIALFCGIIDRSLMFFQADIMMDMEYSRYRLIRTMLVVLIYIVNSHKFWIFYMCCVKFRKDTKELIKSICRPVLSKYDTNTRSRQTSLLQTEQEYGDSWNAARIPLADESENV